MRVSTRLDQDFDAEVLTMEEMQVPSLALPPPLSPARNLLYTHRARNLLYAYRRARNLLSLTQETEQGGDEDASEFLDPACSMVVPLLAALLVLPSAHCRSHALAARTAQPRADILCT